ncbi:hypothetical protein ARMGADRAFT_1089432 [Armillaria gallica]|uniref:Uncharacterized protein n=1 Tax=Armillaria gallica TaxID=47427 RepID=A0A2H3CJQ5_ARMGA|nr:hypothetical protein ARMGADRAFT_1089432 [Armillaria gallica]
MANINASATLEALISDPALEANVTVNVTAAFEELQQDNRRLAVRVEEFQRELELYRWRETVGDLLLRRLVSYPTNIHLFFAVNPFFIGMTGACSIAVPALPHVDVGPMHVGVWTHCLPPVLSNMVPPDRHRLPCQTWTSPPPRSGSPPPPLLHAGVTTKSQTLGDQHPLPPLGPTTRSSPTPLYLPYMQAGAPLGPHRKPGPLGDNGGLAD